MRHPLGTLEWLFLLTVTLAGHSQGAIMGTLWAPRRLPFGSFAIRAGAGMRSLMVAARKEIPEPRVSKRSRAMKFRLLPSH